MIRFGTTGAHTMIDTDVVNGTPIYYTVQAITSNEACDGPISNCVAVTPKPNAGVIKLNSAINASLASPQVTAAFAKLGAEVRPGPPQAFAAFLAAETRKWSQVAKTANIKLE